MGSEVCEVNMQDIYISPSVNNNAPVCWLPVCIVGGGGRSDPETQLTLMTFLYTEDIWIMNLHMNS